MHIPIPDRAQKSKAKASEPILTPGQQAILDEAIARAGQQK